MRCDRIVIQQISREYFKTIQEKFQGKKTPWKTKEGRNLFVKYSFSNS